MNEIDKLLSFDFVFHLSDFTLEIALVIILMYKLIMYVVLSVCFGNFSIVGVPKIVGLTL